MSPPNIPVAALLGTQAGRPGLPLAGRVDTSALLPQVIQGQVLSARVDAVLPDGNSRVTVAGQPMSMALPKYFAPGDTLKLVFVGREPRLTFALNEPPPSMTASIVSSAGRMVASVLPRPGEAAMPATPANAPPLLAAVPEDGAALSSKLAGTLTQSGLFYEAHQAEWIAGKRELAVLLREPQARLAPAPQQQGPPQQAALPSAATGPSAGIPSANDFGLTQSALRGDQAMPQQVQALVQQQLAALETGRLVFQLQVWPDQWMRWEIDEEAQNASAQAQPGDNEAKQRFQTRLHLELPKLGELDATLSFDAAGLSVRLDAAQASSADVLQDNRASLRAALADAGIAATDIAVARHGPA
jgi:hypothetical protein